LLSCTSILHRGRGEKKKEEKEKMLKGKNCCHLDREFYSPVILAQLIELPYIQVLFSYVYFLGTLFYT
jgi:hypothetical protein